MTVQNGYSQLVTSLSALYEQREAAVVADWVMEYITGLKRVDRLIYKNQPLTNVQLEQLETCRQKLLKHEPVQYVLHEAWFAGLKFYVDEHVLIPRPETEELVEWIAESLSEKMLNSTKISIIDIGTGSGCIPVTLKNKLPAINVYALDISEAALMVARKNASTLNADVNFFYANILDENDWVNIPVIDIIVSNPPYIKESEAATMHKNVLENEPHLALFVPDNDALLFYKKIAELAQVKLKSGGALFFEINEALGIEVCNMLVEQGFAEVELREDLQGKPRMVKALRP
jgi:release factor glutamine methyltransferase